MKSIFLLSILMLSSCFLNAQNHRQFANWLCGDYTIKVGAVSNERTLGSISYYNLSNVDSSYYWIVEQSKCNGLTNTRILRISLLDSGYVGLEVFVFNTMPKNEIKSLKAIDLSKLKKLPANQVYFYDRPKRGFSNVTSEPTTMLLDKYQMNLSCCDLLSSYFFKQFKIEENATLKFLKNFN